MTGSGSCLSLQYIVKAQYTMLYIHFIVTIGKDEHMGLSCPKNFGYNNVYNKCLAYSPVNCFHEEGFIYVI